nr:UDP-glycosyltransferase 91A1-like [Ziziphus jujuba var. spinosa]
MAEKDKLHIALFPWLAFGHMIPYLEFAKLIAQKGHRVSFLTTPRNIYRLPKPPSNSTIQLNFVSLPLPKTQNLPEDAEATVDVPYDKIQYLKKSYDGLQESVTLFLEASRPDWILYDFVPYWVAPIASKMGIKTAFFSVFTAFNLSFLGPVSVLKGETDDRRKIEDFTVPPKWIPFPTTVSYRYFEINRIFDFVTVNDSGVQDVYRFGASLESCDIVAVRSCSEFEPEWIQLLQNIHQKPVLPVGQFPPLIGDNGDETHQTWKTLKEWLDKKKNGSVVYVSFGTEAKLTRQEITAIALGLEQSQLAFLWVLRTGSVAGGLVQLPEGFEERTGGRGLMWNSWAPQLKILAHASVGGYLAHAGWSSVVESVAFKKPMILLTFVADQGINARILEEKKMGYCIPRDDQNGSFSSDAVAKSLRLVMVEDEGNIYRHKVKEMSGLFADRDRQDRYLDNFLDYLKSHKTSELSTEQRRK